MIFSQKPTLFEYPILILIYLLLSIIIIVIYYILIAYMFIEYSIIHSKNIVNICFFKYKHAYSQWWTVIRRLEFRIYRKDCRNATRGEQKRTPSQIFDFFVKFK